MPKSLVMVRRKIGRLALYGRVLGMENRTPLALVVRVARLVSRALLVALSWTWIVMVVGASLVAYRIMVLRRAGAQMNKLARWSLVAVLS